jgi:hypothetical protein
MQHKIFTRNADGTPNFDRPVVPDLFESKEAADLALLDNLNRAEIGGAYKDYAVHPVDPEGKPVEMLDAKDGKLALADMGWLVQNAPAVVEVLGAMITSRQLYAIAYREMERVLSRGEGMIVEGGTPDPVTGTIVGGTRRPAHPLTAEMVVQAASGQAAKPFEGQALFETLAERVMPWLGKLVKRDVTQEISDEREAALAAERARMTCPVPIGIAFDPTADAVLQKGQSLILVGYEPAVKYLLDLATTAALAARVEAHPRKVLCVARLYGIDQALQDKAGVEPDHESLRLLKVDGANWCGVATSKKEMAGLVQNHVMGRGLGIPDLWVVDDLALAAMKGCRFGGVAPFPAGAAHKAFLPFCKHVGAALLCGMPTPGERPEDLSGPMWESLRAHGTLRPVTVVRSAPDLEPGKARIVVGRDAFTVDVDVAVLEPVNRIIV